MIKVVDDLLVDVSFVGYDVLEFELDDHTYRAHYSVNRALRQAKGVE